LVLDGRPDLERIRDDVRAYLADVEDDAAADAVLVVVMLAGDAWRHGTPPVTVRIRRSTDSTRLRVEVDDHRPAQRGEQPADYRVNLLDRMTTKRGVEHAGGTTTNWAEIPLTPMV
jgi:hypothetical protein